MQLIEQPQDDQGRTIVSLAVLINQMRHLIIFIDYVALKRASKLRIPYLICWGVRGVHTLNRKDTQVNLTSPWCTLVTSTLYWANEAKGRKTSKINLLRRANNPPSSNDATETRSESQKPACAGNGYKKATAQIPADDDIIYLDSMTLPDQSQMEVWILTMSLTKPNVNVSIGCWNVRTLYSMGKSAQLAREMDKYKIDVIGISECRWMGQGKVKLNTRESLIFSGREDNIHRHGVALMTTMKAEKALLEWKPI